MEEEAPETEEPPQPPPPTEEPEKPPSPPKTEEKPKTEEPPKPPVADRRKSLEKQRSSDRQDEGPGDSYKTYLQMEDCLDKLKLLNYEQEFIRKSNSYKPLSNHYFVTSVNTGEQFYMFTSTASWLIQKAGKAQFEMPQEYDDPNATLARILDECRAKTIDIDFPPNKLKSGAGPQCVYLLDKLADSALADVHFGWQRAAPVAEEPDEANLAVDEAELTAEQFEEIDEDPEMAEDDDEGGFLDLQGLQNLSKPMNGTEGAKEEEGVGREMLQSDTNAIEWKMEVERVMPSLKITVRQDAKDWRAHLEAMQTHRAAIVDTLGTARPQLERLSGEIDRQLQKITSREKYLNSQLEALLTQFRAAQDRLAESRQKYREASGGVTNRSKQLAEITDELEQIKQEMEERGLSLTDGAPLVKVKQAVTKLEQELIAMDVQIAVIEQSLLQAQLRDRSYFQNDLYGMDHGNETTF